jgi:hypothetical protein
LEDRLKEACTVEDIEKSREQLGTHDMDPVDFSTFAFEALWKNNAPFDHLDTFLKNPNLNLPDARNMSTFITNVPPHSLERGQIRRFIATLGQSITLGSVLPEELLHIIENLDITAWQATSTHEARRNKTRAHMHKLVFEAYHTIWKGMLACRVTPLNIRAIHLLLPKVAALRGGHGSTSLHLELFQHAWPIESHIVQGTPSIDQYLLSLVTQIHQSEARDSHPLSVPSISLNRKTLTDIINVLGRFPLPAFLRWICSAARVLATQKPHSKGNEHVAWSGRLNIFLSSLRDAELFETHFDFDSVTLADKDSRNADPADSLSIRRRCRLRGTWDELYKVLAPDISLADMQPYLVQFDNVDICRIILHRWVPTLSRKAAPSAPGKHGASLHNKGIAKQGQSKVQFESMMADDYKLGGKSYGDVRAFPNLFAVLARSDVSYRNLMGEVFRFVHEHHGPAGLLDLCELLREKQVPIYSTPVLKVLDDISSTDPTLAYILYKCHNIWISRCPELLFTLIKEGVHSHEIFRILKDREEANTVPPAQRLHPVNATSDLRNTMIHMVADTMSRYPHRGVRVAFRDVSACYRYLLDRHAPIHPIMGRALVRTGVTQFLQDKRWASTERFKWILNIVRDLEGDKVADELDTVMFRWRERVKVFMREQSRILRDRGMFTGSWTIETATEAPSRGWGRGRHVLRSRSSRIRMYDDARPLRIKLYSTGGETVQQQSLRGLPHEEYIHRYLNGGKLTVAGFPAVKRLPVHHAGPIRTNQRKRASGRLISKTSDHRLEKPTPTFFESLPPVRRRRKV